MILVLVFLFPDSDETKSNSILAWAWLIYPGLMIGLVIGYYRVKPDLAMLTLCGMSAIVISVAVLIRVWPWNDDMGSIFFGSLMIGAAVIGETALLVQRLARLHRDWERAP
jgi:hypothetical protein